MPFRRTVWTLLIAVLAAQAQPATSPPNVIIVLSDDQGMGDFSCYGNPVLKTPNLDSLHRRSVRLGDFHVAPMCTPTRGQLMSGMDCLRNGAASVSAGRSFLRPGIPTMAQIFSAGGFRTGLFGKWHLGDSYPNLPHFKGLHESVYHLGWGVTSMADTWCNDCFDGRFFHNGTLKKYPGFCTDVFFDQAMDWMKKQADAGRPFFTYIPTNAPHAPHWVAEKYRAPYMGKGPAAFYGMIANVDENVGRLEKFLTDSKLRDNTILIYFHDNGGTSGVKNFNAGLRAGKTTYYEGGHRAACFINGPKRLIGDPRELNDLTQVQDLLPTLIELCGLPTPKEARFDGISLASRLRGSAESLPDRTLVVQYGEQPGGQPLLKDRSCVMWKRWRLVHGAELYDLATDPAQEKDVASAHPAIAKQLKDYYDRWWKTIEPLTEDFVPVVIGAREQNPVTLSSADWMKTYCDNMRDLRTGAAKNGAWRVTAAEDGTYEIALRRWPKEADAAIAGSVPEFKAVEGLLPKGTALPVEKVRLKIGTLDETRAVTAADKEVTFTVTLKKGQTLPMQSWLIGPAGKELSGAYFAYINRR